MPDEIIIVDLSKIPVVVLKKANLVFDKTKLPKIFEKNLGSLKDFWLKPNVIMLKIRF